ncbi:MAG: hypothetical protein IT423_17980, partial [Pirellulaceae bacterium]|nr:hypothetical protein [Pirellulaceae bacterium]
MRRNKIQVSLALSVAIFVSCSVGRLAAQDFNSIPAPQVLQVPQVPQLPPPGRTPSIYASPPNLDPPAVSGYVEQGFSQEGFSQPAYSPPGSSQPGYVDSNYSQSGFNQSQGFDSGMMQSPMMSAVPVVPLPTTSPVVNDRLSKLEQRLDEVDAAKNLLPAVKVSGVFQADAVWFDQS